MTTAIFLSSVGCSSGSDASVAPRGLLDSQGNPLPRKPQALPPKSQSTVSDDARMEAPSRSSAAGLPSLFDDPPGAAARREEPTAASTPTDLGAPEQPERDLSAELRALVGQPSQCIDLDTVAEQGGKLTVQIGAYVLSTGAITRASVSAPGQPASTIRCIEQQVVAQRLRDPVPNTPRTVRAELGWEVVRSASRGPGNSVGKAIASGSQVAAEGGR